MQSNCNPAAVPFPVWYIHQAHVVVRGVGSVLRGESSQAGWLGPSVWQGAAVEGARCLGGSGSVTGEGARRGLGCYDTLYPPSTEVAGCPDQSRQKSESVKEIVMEASNESWAHRELVTSDTAAMESCSLVLGPLKLLCAAATEASAAAAPGGASTATLGLLGVALVFATAALLLLSPVLYLKLPPTMLGPQARAAERLILSLRLPLMAQP